MLYRIILKNIAEPDTEVWVSPLLCKLALIINTILVSISSKQSYMEFENSVQELK